MIFRLAGILITAIFVWRTYVAVKDNKSKLDKMEHKIEKINKNVKTDKLVDVLEDSDTDSDEKKQIIEEVIE